MNLKPRLSSDGSIITSERGWTLAIPAGSPRGYRLAQLDDHRGLARMNYACRPPMQFQLDARVSLATLPGTWGFGLWNDPYGFSFGPGNGFLTLPALPNAAWFFFSSASSYLSFRDDTPANGFLAQVFSSPRFDPLLIRAALTIPFSPRQARRLLSRVIREDSACLDCPPPTAGRSPSHDVTQWHHYSIQWTKDATLFKVDDRSVLETQLTPRDPLGIVIWIDNQYAAFTPQGKVRFGLEANPEPAWLEIRDVGIR